jgi:hypothetical protein
MREAAGDCCLVAVALEARRNRFIPGGAGEVRAAVEDAVLGIDGLGKGGVAGVGARRVARDQIVDSAPGAFASLIMAAP